LQHKSIFSEQNTMEETRRSRPRRTAKSSAKANAKAPAKTRVNAAAKAQAKKPSNASKFREAQRKSQSIFQFQCRWCDARWWGSAVNNKCHGCDTQAAKLPLKDMVGIGWYECSCGRKFAGFAQGNVRSKCHRCNVQLLPSFIVPGDEASDHKKESKHVHHCAKCHGIGDCPVVKAARMIG
jgi:hypothetical protein